MAVTSGARTRVPGRILVVAMVAAAALAAAAIDASQAQAGTVRCSTSMKWVPNAHPVCERWRYAKETVFLKHNDFLARKSDFSVNGCNAQMPQPSGCRKPPPYNRYDWTTDGCSGPTPADWAAIFDGPCQQHDFGYRNFGKRRIQRTETRRYWVDRRFYVEMRRICRTWEIGPARGACFQTADTMYIAVRTLGVPAFWG